MATRLDIFIKTSDSRPAYIAYQPLDANGSPIGEKSAYSIAIAETTGAGYQWRYSIMSMAVKASLFIRPDTNTQGEVQLVVTRPAADTARYTIYPTGNTNPQVNYNTKGDLVGYLSN